MGKFKFTYTEIEGVFIAEPAVFPDERGYFMETYNENDFKEEGIDLTFVQGKLVRVISGEVFDVAVDLRKASRTYGKWIGVRLSAENKKQFFIPKGFAHGFVVLSDEAEFVYKCTDFYKGDDEGGILWNDPDIGIEWPIEDIGEENILLSEKDKLWKPLKDTDVDF